MLAFCCNDYRNGMFAGKVDAIKFGAGRGDFNFGTDYLEDYELDLTGPEVHFRWLGNVSTYSIDSFRIGRRKFPCRGQTDWVGNWCWDACFVTRDVIRELCPWLKSRGFSPESGASVLWRWWESLEVIA